MKTTQDYLEARKAYQREVNKVKKNLPSNWIQIIINRRKRIGKTKYVKLYNDMVNMINGRSYKLYLSKQDLFEEIVELANQYKNEN
jgi:hypothetical protein